MRGEVVRDARPGRARNALVALQVTASVLLLICSAVFLRSALGGSDGRSRYPHSRYRHRRHPERAEAGGHARRREERAVRRLGCGLVAGRAGRARRLRRPARLAGRPSRTSSSRRNTSASSASIIVRGRGFAQTERSASAAVAVVSESVARQLWPGLDAVGQVLRLEPDPKRRHAGSRMTRRFSRAPSSSSASPGTWRAFGSPA